MSELTEYEYKVITSILRKKVKEQAEYIADLESRLGTPDLQEKMFKKTMSEIVKKVRKTKKKGK